MKNLFDRIKFMIRFKTLNSIVVDPSNNQAVLFLGKSGLRQGHRYCPHQGAPLDKFGSVNNGELVCGWHGCRFSGVKK